MYSLQVPIAGHSRHNHHILRIELPYRPARQAAKDQVTAESARCFKTRMPKLANAKHDMLSEMLGRLYAPRIDADYRPPSSVGSSEAQKHAIAGRENHDIDRQ